MQTLSLAEHRNNVAEAMEKNKLKAYGDYLLFESLDLYPDKGYDFTGWDGCEIREKKGLQLDSCAELLGVNPELILAWESGRVRVPLSYALFLELWEEKVDENG